MSTTGWTPVSDPAKNTDTSGWTPVQETSPAPKKSWLDSASDFAKGIWSQVNPVQAVQGAAQLTAHPIQSYYSDATNRQAIMDKAEAAFKKGNYAEGMAHALYGIVPFVGPQLESTGEKFQQGKTAEALGESTGMGLVASAPGVVRGVKAGVGAAIPSAAEAGQALGEVRSLAGDVPIDMTRPGNSALQLYEQSQRGATLPKVVRDFVKRATTPGSDPITYGEAKDFQSNVSALSADEKMSLKPNTKRLLGQLNADLKSSLEDAADTVGKGEQFTDAMKEYHNAMRLKGFTDAAIDAAIKGALTGAGIYGARAIWDAGQGINK